MDFLKSTTQRFFKSNQRSDILMDEEEQRLFFDKQSEKQSQKTSQDDDGLTSPERKKLQKKRLGNYFDKDRLTLKEVKEYLNRSYQRNKEGIEKFFIILVIIALAIALVGISVLLISTFDQDNIQRKIQLLDNEVIKPVNDMRNGYKLITLPNQLQALIIWNNSTQFTSVSLDVHAGSWQEPQSIPGLAHLLEHMTFLQSKKYDNQYYFDNFLSVNSGYTDSFTSFDHTNYFFSVRSQELQKALDIFAHMFIDPIYDLELSKKESSVVESEFKVSLQNDDQKIRYLLSILSVPSHPYSRFTSGNVQSLRDNFDIDIVEELEKFRKTYYSSNLMKLVVFTDESIEKVEEYLQPFSEITNNFADEPNFSEFHKPIKHTKKIIKLKTLDENEVFYMVFQIDLDKSQYRKRPIEFITFFLNNNMDGGLKYYLKDKLDIIIDLEVGNVLDQEDYSIFYIKFFMQNEKLVEYQKVVNSIMNYLEFIKEEGLQESIYDERAYIANLTFSYNAHTVMTQENVSNYAWNLNEYDYKEVFAADSTWSDTLDKYHMNQVINQMQNFENIILIAGSSNFSNKKLGDLTQEDYEEILEMERRRFNDKPSSFVQTKSKTISKQEETQIEEEIDEEIIKETFESEHIEEVVDDKEDEYLKNDDFDNKIPLYDIQYTERILRESQIERMTKINKSLVKSFKVEPKNTHIPQSIVLEDICALNKMSIDYEHIDLSAHTLPDANSNICLFNPYENPTRKFTNFNFTAFDIQFQLTCDSEAYIDKYQKHPSLVKYENGIEGWYKFDLFYKVPQAIGYFNILFEDRFESSKDVLTGKIIAKIFQKEIEEKLCNAIDAGYFIEVSSQYSSLTLKIWKELQITKEDYQNAEEEVSFEIDDYKQWDTTQQGEDYFLKKVLLEEFIDPKIQLEILEKITYEDAVEHASKERNNSKLIAMIIGNIQSSTAQELLNKIDEKINFKKEIQEYRNVYGVFDIDSLYFIKVKSIGSQQDLSRSIVSFYQIDKRNAITITEGKIVTRLLKQFIYNYLITEKQQIYKITTEIVSFGSLDGIVITLKGDKSNMKQMQQHLQDAISAFHSKLPLVLESEYEQIQQTQLGDLMSSPPTLKDRAEYLWKQLNQFNYVFDEQDILISQLLNTTKDDIISAFESIFVKNPKAVIIQIHNHFDPISKYSVSKNKKQNNKDKEIKVITNIYKQMKNRNFNKFAGEIL